MKIKLEDCKLISNKQYMDLKNPKFKGQTIVNSEGCYYMIWESDGILYKTYNHI